MRSKRASRSRPVSSFESRTLYTRRSRGITAAPTEIGPAQAPRPTSSTPTTISAPESHSPRSTRIPGGHCRSEGRSRATDIRTFSPIAARYAARPPEHRPTGESSAGSAIDLVRRARLGLGVLLHLRRHRRSLPLAGERAAQIGGDTERNRHDGEGVPLAASIDDLDVAAESVVRIVEVQDAVVEALDHFLAEALGHLRIHHHDEVV